LKISREIKTAVLVIASILLFIWGYSFLKGRDLLTSYKSLYARYDNVEGLTMSAPVTLNGFIIGKVSKIELQNSTGHFIVEMQIKSDFPITKSSEANLYEPGFIGGKQVQIVPNFTDRTIAESGDFLPGHIVPGLTTLLADKLTPLQEKIEKMVVSADALLTNLNGTLDPKTRKHLQASIASLDATLIEFRQTAANANGLLADNRAHINATMANFDKTSANFSRISDSLAKANLAGTVRKLESTLASVDKITADLNSGKGSMGKLLKDDKLYANFNNSAKELQLLLQDLRLNPTRYINVSLFGKKNKPYVAPKTNDTIPD
jgi:phospholipid/cholesterol/gamma-HCH transport system substrate-binding protein